MSISRAHYAGYLDNAGMWDIYCIMFKDLNTKQTADASPNSAERCNKYSLLHQARFLDDHESGKRKTHKSVNCISEVQI